MAKVRFTPNLARWVDTSVIDAGGTTLREALDAVFAERPALAGYVLTDQGTLRQHVNIYVDGAAVLDRVRLSDPVSPTSSIFIAQALSGG